jgi:hypothetical protein
MLLDIINFMTKFLAIEKPNRLISKTLTYFSFLFLLLISLNSCYKPAGKIGDEIQPEQSKLKVYYSDTTTVYAYSIPEDSVRTDELTRNQLGSIVDPVFGSTVAGFYTQFLLSSFSQSFGTNPVMDSIFLYLYYDGFYGDTTTQLRVSVYEMEDTLDVDALYYSNINKAYYPTDYADYTFVPKPSDSIVVEGDTLPPMLRINLSANPVLADKLLKAPSEALESNEAFLEYFKGLYVTTEPVSSNGSILYFNLLKSFSRLIVHFKNDEADSLYYNFLITSDAARVNKYKHDFSTGNAAFQQQVVNGDTLLGTQQYYVQGTSGVRSVIRFPFIDEWNKLEKVAVNEAKLILGGVESETYNGEPSRVIVVQRTEDGSYKVLQDNLESGDYFGGTYKPSVNEYQFRITDYIQSLISNPDEPDYGLYLFVYGSAINPQRFIFAGNDPLSDTLSMIRLEMIYTDL